MVHRHFYKALSRVSLEYVPLASFFVLLQALSHVWLLQTKNYLILHPLKIDMASKPPHMVSLKKHEFNMRAIRDAPPTYTILSRNASGEPGPEYPAERACHVIAAIHICRSLLGQPRVRDAFKTVAVTFSMSKSNPWYSQLPNAMTMEGVTDFFINSIIATFPKIIVDYTLNNPDSKGFHTRRAWQEPFEPGLHTIAINGKVSGAFVVSYTIGPRAS